MMDAAANSILDEENQQEDPVTLGGGQRPVVASDVVGHSACNGLGVVNMRMQSEDDHDEQGSSSSNSSLSPSSSLSSIVFLGVKKGRDIRRPRSDDDEGEGRGRRARSEQCSCW